MSVQTDSAVSEERAGGALRKLAGHMRGTSPVYAALLVLIVVNLIVTHGFATASTLQNILFSVAPVILIAVGQAVAVGTGGIDLSVGSVMALSSAVVALYLGYGEVAAIGMALLAALVLGVVNGAMVSVLRINPLITGLALLVAVRGLAQALSGGSRSDIPSGGVFGWLGTASVLGVPFSAVIAAALGVVVAWAVSLTTFGRYALFAGSNQTAAHLTGVPRNSVLIAVYAISGLLAGIAGVLVSARIGASDPSFIGINFELTAIAAVVIGGTPLSGGKVRIGGTMAAALFLQLLDTTFIMNNIDFAYAQILKAALIVAALYLQRAGKDAR